MLLTLLSIGVLIYLTFLYFSKEKEFTSGTYLEPNKNDYDVTIIGAGPSGVLLAIQLLKLGIKNILILEKRIKPTTHSKAIGIHRKEIIINKAPSLELFQGIDPQMVEDLISVGLKVEHGVCLKNSFDEILGELNLFLMQKPFNFILCNEQFKTEEILRKYLEKFGGKIQLGCIVESCEMNSNGDGVNISYSKDEKIINISTSFVVGCDGKNSIVKKSSKIEENGSDFLDTFVMGDFTDNTTFKGTGAIFLSDFGLVESFPLPSGLRRWVCSTSSHIENPERKDIEEIVKQRAQFDISKQENFMISSYKGIQWN
jgi:2-polyprenyl-6-methoxyphenol hydroxylase-like FAD-dependent oxidoreductase